ncbi:MAG: hypothetical protein Q7U18_12995 [Methylobacter sp.]|nr:hypothetical protein [Methylobacter sp.]
MQSLYLNEMSAKQTAVLADEAFLSNVIGKTRSELISQGNTALLDVLAKGDMQSQARWRAVLSNQRIHLFDINRVSGIELQRIPDMSQQEIDWVIGGRPYLSSAELAMETDQGIHLATILEPFVVYPTLMFIDKTSGQQITFSLNIFGIIAVWSKMASADRVQNEMAKVVDDQPIIHFAGDGVSLLPTIKQSERPTLSRALASSEVIRSLAAYFVDADGLSRAVHPFRLELCLKTPMESVHLPAFLNQYDAHVRKMYDAKCLAADITADRHDLDALYRTLNRLVADEHVSFCEPFYLNIEPE